MNPVVIAFVSGKGGVGKTGLAANFGWICSRFAKTLLIDLDFQNQGLTGLFTPHAEFQDSSAVDAIIHAEAGRELDFTELDFNLQFLPAVNWQRRLPYSEISDIVTDASFPAHLEKFIATLGAEEHAKVVALDCHGGLDAVSLAAFRISDVVLMVTEPDSVTFNGTTELLDYYEQGTLGTHARGNANRNPKESEPAQREANTKVRIVVNRLPGKYRIADLDRIFGRHLVERNRNLVVASAPIIYIPREELLSETFGTYPFHVKLAPWSTYSKKCALLVYDVLAPTFGDNLRNGPRVLGRMFRDMHRNAVRRTTRSATSKNTSSILNFFGWFSTLYGFGFLALVAMTISNPRDPFRALLQAIEYNLFARWTAIGIAVLLTGAVLWNFYRTLLGLMFIYRDRHRYEWALYNALPTRRSPTQLLSVGWLLLMRVGTAIIPVVTAAYVVGLSLLLIATLSGLFRAW